MTVLCFHDSLISHQSWLGTNTKINLKNDTHKHFKKIDLTSICVGK